GGDDGGVPDGGNGGAGGGGGGGNGVGGNGTDPGTLPGGLNGAAGGKPDVPGMTQATGGCSMARTSEQTPAYLLALILLALALRRQLNAVS
ncbi:MAG: hypothetical protein JWN44_5675, partial [Myxococcales bacterium]|nr:hypothetical protein [Myxococcales bacterium]